jgi:indolepyruvate ferredoxin oxidoreductase
MDSRFTKEEGLGIFTGNELIVKGGLEGGIGLLTGYPGSPVAEVFDAAQRISELLAEKGIVAQIANNEALSAARLNGSQMQGIRAMAVMKSVGAHVASDGLALGNMAGTGEGGAAVAVFGDDTWSEGTQVPADSRFMARHLYMPLLEPSTFQEVKDWVGAAFDLSEASRLYVAYLVTSNQADGGGTVTLNGNRYPDLTAHSPTTIDSRTISVDERVIIPPDTALREEEVLSQRYPRLLDEVRRMGLNRILNRPDVLDRPDDLDRPDTGRSRVGFISSSLAYCYLEHALGLAGVQGRFPILKYGLTYPLDVDILREFAGLVDEIYVVEEKRSFLEEQVASALRDLHQNGEVGPYRVWGKRFADGQQGFPSSRGMNPSIVLRVLAPVLRGLDDPAVDADRLDREVALIEETRAYRLKAAARTPAFCPGCPHRDSAAVLNRVVDDFMDPDYMTAHHSKAPTDLVFHGDIGCYTLLKYKPFDRLMHNLSGMGLGGGTGAGIDPFITNKQLVFMGDSTFFHSGMAAISDSIKHGQDITYVILDNKTTAMTGHQPTPGVNVDIVGKPTFAQDIERIVRGMADGPAERVFVTRMDPGGRDAYRETLEKALLKEGVKIVIADKECGITNNRRQKAAQRAEVKARGFLPEEQHINITPEVCEYCLECTRATGCSGLTVEETLHGPKVATDLSLCVTDGACTKVTVANGDKTCPSFEEVRITRRQAPRTETESIDVSGLPEVPPAEFETAWYAYVAGVGGMGINTISAVLSVAGARQGYTVRFTNKKGLAVRNGAVYSHVSFAKGDSAMSSLTPYGHADLLLGLDILEAVRGLDPDGTGRVASPEHTTAIVETGKRHTINTLTGEEDFDPAELEVWLKQYTNPDRYFGMDLGEISERFLGNKIYANSILLGVAYQKGVLPLELENIRWAMRHNIGKDLEPNLKAFDLGRKIALDPSGVEKQVAPLTFQGLVDDKAAILTRRRGRKTGEVYRALAGQALEMDLAEEDRVRFGLGVYDLMQWGGEAQAERYAAEVRSLYGKDRAETGYEATGAVIRYLARVMAYKDEIYVAELLTGEEKRRRDAERYNLDPDRGDRIAYRHLTRPHFEVMGFSIKFDMKTRDWMLKALRGMRFLRALLPAWHREEKVFRDWYLELVAGFACEDEEAYRNYVKALNLPEEVRGYREVIWPKMKVAYKEAERLGVGSEKSGAGSQEPGARSPFFAPAGVTGGGR